MHNQSRPLLVIEDNHDDYELLSRTIDKAGVKNPVYRLVIGSDVMDYLNRRMGHQKRKDEPLPALIFLDLRLPAADGKDLLQEIKSHPHFRDIPVVVMSTSTNPRDIRACYQAGANAYVVKSMNVDKYMTTLGVTLDYWINHVELPGDQ